MVFPVVLKVATETSSLNEINGDFQLLHSPIEQEDDEKYAQVKWVMKQPPTSLPEKVELGIV